ncbi:MAG: rod shape-determining protein RodA [Lysobacterales bacterium]
MNRPRLTGLARMFVWWRDRLDWPLLVGLALIVAAGMVTLHSSGSGAMRLELGQGARVGVGLALLLLLTRVSPMHLRLFSPWAYVGSLALLALVPLFGSGRSARLWLDLGVFYLQPSELLKITVPMIVAWYLFDRPLPVRFRDVLVCVVLIGLPSAMIALQPDLGTALLVAASGVFALFLAGLSWWLLGTGAVLAAAAAPLAWWFWLKEYQKDRILTFLDPGNDPQGAGWNIIQSSIAVGSGGLTGKGWGASTQARLEYLPEHTTDFAFAVLAEEFGFIGVSSILLVYLFIVLRTLWIATEARDSYGRLVAGALGLAFFVYVFVNGGMITGLLPVVGVPMPLVSYGGTSAVTLLAAFGIVLGVRAHHRLAR